MTSTPPPPFVIVFPSLTSLIPSAHFNQVSPTQWVLDLSQPTVAPLLHTLPRELLFTLSTPNALPADDFGAQIALSLYTVVIDGTNPNAPPEHSFRGYLSNAHPSALFPVFVETHSSNDYANKRFQVHIVVEPLAEVQQKETSKQATKADFCKRVGMDLFNFIQSYSGQTADPSAIARGDQLIVPANVIDRWWTRFRNRMARDPDFLLRQAEVV
jgi:hypothetical protein